MYSEDLPTNSFIHNNNIYDVHCVFQIWIKKNTERALKKKETPSDYYSFVKKTENPDFSIRRVGFYAGKIYTDINKNEQSHYFLKLSPTVSKIQFIKYYDSLIFESNNTVGSKSISKQEFISLLNLFNT